MHALRPFHAQIFQTGELQVMRRGHHAEIDIFPGEPVDNPLAGNVVIFAPSALARQRFPPQAARLVSLQAYSICTRCSTGCISAQNGGTLWRFKPRHNPLVNDYWICDEGRYSFKAANDLNLLTAMYVREGGDLRAGSDRSCRQGRQWRAQQIAERGGKIAGVLSPFLTVEEAFLLASYLKMLSPASVLALGPVPVVGTDQVFQPDQTKGRTGDTSFVVPRNSRSTPRSARTAGE